MTLPTIDNQVILAKVVDLGSPYGERLASLKASMSDSEISIDTSANLGTSSDLGAGTYAFITPKPSWLLQRQCRLQWNLPPMESLSSSLIPLLYLIPLKGNGLFPQSPQTQPTPAKAFQHPYFLKGRLLWLDNATCHRRRPQSKGRRRV